MVLIPILIAWIFGIGSMGSSLPVWITSIAPALWLLSLLTLLPHLLKFNIAQNRSFKAFQMLLLCISTTMLGAHYAELKLKQRLTHRITAIEHMSTLIYVEKIDEQSIQKGETVTKQRVSIVNHDPRLKQDLWVYLKRNANLKNFELGQYYWVEGEVKPAHSYAIAGVFDQEKWFIQHNIMGTMRVSRAELRSKNDVQQLGYSAFIEQHSTRTASILLAIEKKRLDFRAYIQAQPLSHKGLILALLTGDESLLSDTTKAQFKVLGISHLLAISGPHVLIFAVLFCYLFNLMISKFSPRLLLIIARPDLLMIPFVSCVLAYTAFVGFEIPALRTCLTVILISTVLLLRQKIQPLKLILLSASLLLLIDPLSILSAAFWLSYGACFILIRVYQTIQQQPKNQIKTWKSQLKRFSAVLIESQWKVFIALFPLLIVIFHQVSWLAPVINLIAIPFIGLIIVPIELVAAILSWVFAPVGLVLFHLADSVLSVMLWIFELIQHIFSPKLHWMALTPWMILSLALGIYILFLPRAVVPKAWAILCLLPWLIGTKTETEFSLSVLDVGQGQGIFLNLPQHKMMIDVGGYYDEEQFSIAKQLIIPYLMRQGISTLDQVILTHLDQDHAGAFNFLNQDIAINKVSANERDARFKDSNFEYCYEGQQWQFDQIKIQVLAPTESSLSNVQDQKNELSCIVYIQVPQAGNYQHFLLMGDAGWEAEYRLLQKYPDLKVDVLVLGHHGSQHSSSFDFLKRLQPKLAVISAGFNNQYQHPHPIVLARLKALSIPVYSTIQQGSIEFRLKDHQIQVLAYRHEKLWLQR